MVLQQGDLRGWGDGGGEDWLALCVPIPGRNVMDALSAAASTPFLLLQGYQDHSLLALQFTFELMSVLLGVRLPGHRLHSLGLRRRGKQVSHRLPPGAIVQGIKTPERSPISAMLPRPAILQEALT